MLNLMRNMFFFEEDNNLVLTPVLPEQWLEEGGEIAISQAPSYFGTIAFNVKSEHGRLLLELNNQWHHKPGHIEFNIPIKVKAALIDGKPVEKPSQRLILPANAHKVIVESF